MPSEKVAISWGLLIILIVLFPTFNNNVNVVSEHVNATILEAGLITFLPLTYVVIAIGYFGFVLYYTVEDLE